MEPVLLLDRVGKNFGPVCAVNELSFSVSPGEIFGFLGGNGAGKTTTLRMVLNIIRPDRGQISVLGSGPGSGQASRLGFLAEERGLYAKMSAIETLQYFGQLKGMTAAQARSQGMTLLERFEIADRAQSQIGDLSKGMAQKVQLATALVNRPELIILDEPFSGLDPVNQGLLEQEILRASGEGAAVVFSTHVMQHAERLCHRLLLLKQGSKRFEGTIAEAQSQLPGKVIATAGMAIGTLPGLAAATRLEDLDDGWARWELELVPGVNAEDILEHCTRHGVALRKFEERRPSLHEVFVWFVGGEGEQA